jgi:hypothetical protein
MTIHESLHIDSPLFFQSCMDYYGKDGPYQLSNGVNADDMLKAIEIYKSKYKSNTTIENREQICHRRGVKYVLFTEFGYAMHELP